MFVSLNGEPRWIERAVTLDYEGLLVPVRVYGELSAVNGKINDKQTLDIVVKRF